MRWDGPSPTAPEGLIAMLRAGARGLYVEEAAVELVLRHGYWIGREDFTGRFVHEQADPEPAGDQPAAAIDWLGAVEGLTVTGLRRIGKRIAIGLEGDLWVVLHLMIAGRLPLRKAGSRLAGRNALGFCWARP